MARRDARVVKLPDDDEVADMYALAREIAVRGYEHYEISNWAKRPNLNQDITKFIG